MSIQVVVSSTAAGVSVSGGTAVAITVGSTSASVPVTVSGGIGPAGFVVAPGTATSGFGTFQLTAGDGITISTTAGQFQIASYGTGTVSSLAPVQSVAGRVGAVQLQASDVTAGTFAIARIPTISYTALSNVPATLSPSAHTHDAAAITSGVLELARIPTIGYTALSGVPATFAPQAHTHSTADVVGLTASFSQVAHAHQYVQVLNGLTGTVSIAGGAGVTVSTASSSITISAAGGGGGGGVGADDTVDGGDYAGVVASISITQQPADVSVAINQGSTGSASFTVAASASTGVPVSYQWQQNTGSAWSSIDGGTSATLTRSVTGSDNGNAYRCIVTAFNVPQVTSNSASLTVTVIVPSAPVITISSQPQSATILSTQSTASFSASASATQSQAVAFQWQRRPPGGTSWQNVAGGTASTLSLTGLTYDQDNGASYRVMVTASGAAAVYSNTVSLAITWAAAPRITLASESTATSLGSAAYEFRPYYSSNVTVADTVVGATSVSYQWEAALPYGDGFSTQNFRQNTGVNTTSRTIQASNYLVNSYAYYLRCVITATNSYGTTTVTTGTFTYSGSVV
jgi:hypothetical protein